MSISRRNGINNSTSSVCVFIYVSVCPSIYLSNIVWSVYKREVDKNYFKVKQILYIRGKLNCSF